MLFSRTAVSITVAALAHTTQCRVIRNHTVARSSDTAISERSENILFSAWIFQSSDCSGDYVLAEWFGSSRWDVGCFDLPGNSVHLFWPGCGHFAGTATTHSEGGCGGSSSATLSGQDVCQSNLPYNAVQWQCNHPGPA